MIKKLSIIILFFVTLQIQAQFFKGIGVYGALTESMHRYRNYDKSKKVDTVFVPQYYYPQDHYSREYFSWGAGIFAEFSRSNGVRWQTELEYANKGAKEKEIVDQYLGTRAGSFSVNKYTYIQWNNYLKFFGPFGLPNNIYLMPGIRLEYLFKKSTSVFNPYSSKLPIIWYSADIAIGYQFPLFRNFYGLVEYHYNPDLYNLKVQDNVRIRNRTFETRVGIMYRPRKRNIDDCNTPRYKGPAY
jgi:hypothetical protein